MGDAIGEHPVDTEAVAMCLLSMSKRHFVAPTDVTPRSIHDCMLDACKRFLDESGLHDIRRAQIESERMTIRHLIRCCVSRRANAFHCIAMHCTERNVPLQASAIVSSLEREIRHFIIDSFKDVVVTVRRRDGSKFKVARARGYEDWTEIGTEDPEWFQRGGDWYCG